MTSVVVCAMRLCVLPTVRISPILFCAVLWIASGCGERKSEAPAQSQPVPSAPAGGAASGASPGARGPGAGAAAPSSIVTPENGQRGAVLDGSPPSSEANATGPAVPRPEHAVWTLVANRPTAHLQLDGDLYVDAGLPNFVRYVGFGTPVRSWQLGATVDEVAVAVPKRNAPLSLPLTSAQANSKFIALRIYGHAGALMLIKLRGEPLAKIELIDGWQTAMLPVGEGKLRAGENPITLDARPSARKAQRVANGTVDRRIALAWVRVTSAATLPEVNRASGLRWDGTQNLVTFERPGVGMVWYVQIPEGAHLVGDTSQACGVIVQAALPDGSFVGGALRGPSGRVDLSKMAGQVVRLSLANQDCETVALKGAAITLHGAAPTLPEPSAAPPKYVVLWIMDAMRADRIPAFTPGARAQTPNLDELAKTSAVFRQYYVQGNESQVSHSSVWTSLYPARHNVRMAGTGGTWQLSKKFNILGQELHDAGLIASGTTGNGFVNANGGYARGFDEFRNMMREKGILNGIIYGEQIVSTALKRLEVLKDKPTFLFFGTIDTHGPWIARKPWIDIYSPPPYDGPFQEFGTAKDLGIKPDSMGCAIIPPPRDIERLRAIYDSAISYIDKEVGRFIAQLKAWDIWDETMLIITADHGEELFEDRRCGHGGSLRDTLTRVPLLIHYPAKVPGGFIDEGAEGVDVLPTMLDALGKPLFASAQGQSLLPLANGVGRGWLRPSYATMYEYAHAMRLGRWKLRVPRVGPAIVHDLVEDRDEKVNVAHAQPFAERMLTDALALLLATRTHWQKSLWGVVTNLTEAGAAALGEPTALDDAWRVGA